MADIVTIYLPLSTYVTVQGFTNSYYQQQVIVTQENGLVNTMVGSGENNTPMQNGSFSIQTPPSSQSPQGYMVTVNMQSQQNGNWVPSMTVSGKVSVAYCNIAAVASEDGVDTDWNDSFVQFIWWTPMS